MDSPFGADSRSLIYEFPDSNNDFSSSIVTDDKLAKGIKQDEADGVVQNTGSKIMAVARVTKITASSPEGFQQAVDSGLERAAETLHGITGLEVESMKAKVENGRIVEYRATIEITFVLD